MKKLQISSDIALTIVLIDLRGTRFITKMAFFTETKRGRPFRQPLFVNARSQFESGADV
jgi:hypothetical protein